MVIAVLVILSAFVVSVQAAEIHGQKWNDIDRNGVKDAGEAGVQGVQICVGHNIVANSTTVKPIPIDCAVSDIDGVYALANVPAGDYYVYEDISPGYRQSYPTASAGNYHVTLGSDDVISGLDFGNYQLVAPPPDVTITQQLGTQDGIPTVLRPPLTTLTIQKKLAGYQVVSVNLQMKWSDGTSITAPMTEVDTINHIWEANIPPPYPPGTAGMIFSVDVYPGGNFPGPEDLTQVGDIIFIDPSGQILDWCTGLPINGALVTLYLYDPVTKVSELCPLDNIWYPKTNTLITGADGRYFWMTSTGNYYVTAEMAGYEPAQSATVMVPPPATGLDVRLHPTAICGNIPVHSLAISLQQVQIFLNGAKKVQVQGKFTLNAGSDGIDPVSDGVNVRFFLSGSLPGSGQFYPSTNNIMPVYLQTTARGWAIASAEKGRTGIQDMEIQKTRDPLTFTFKLVDTKTGITAKDYRNIVLEISSGNDAGVSDVTLTGKNGKYTL